jgi:phosphoglycolate phosphatase
MVGNGIKKLLIRALPAEKQTPEEAERLLPDFSDYYEACYADKTTAYDGVPELVRELKAAGVRMAVITNKPHHMALKVVEKLYPSAFDLVLGQRDGAPTKPDPFLVNAAVKTLAVEKEACAFVGDSGVDMRTAVNGGILPVGVLWGFRDREDLAQNGARYIVSNPRELLELIYKLMAKPCGGLTHESKNIRI